VESFENDPSVPEEMSDDELIGLLQRWQVPPMPPGLRRAVFPEPSQPGWKRIWKTSIRVPVPLAVALLVLLALAGWRGKVGTASKIEAPNPRGKAGSQMAFQVSNGKTPRPASPSEPKHASAWRLAADLRPRVIHARDITNSDDKK
jgi:hypothetical protein